MPDPLMVSSLWSKRTWSELNSLINTWIGPYLVREVLGEGGMGLVYLGQHKALPRLVAIKTLTEEAAGDLGRLKRFQLEASTQAALEHENIARVYDYIETETGVFLVMEYVKGVTFHALSAMVELSEADVMNLLAQTLRGLAFAHEHGVVHRDLKASNLMVRPDGTVKILDFGIAKTVKAPKLTQTGYLVGTPEYIAPEIVAGQEADARSDLYSAGIVTYQMLAGHTPVTGATPFEVWKGHLEGAIAPLASVRSGLHPAVVYATTKALSIDPAERWQTAKEWMEAIAPHAGRTLQLRIEDPNPGIRPLSVAELGTPPPSAVTPTGRGKSLPIWVLFGSVGLIVFIGVWIAFSGSGAMADGCSLPAGSLRSEVESLYAEAQQATANAAPLTDPQDKANALAPVAGALAKLDERASSVADRFPVYSQYLYAETNHLRFINDVILARTGKEIDLLHLERAASQWSRIPELASQCSPASARTICLQAKVGLQNALNKEVDLYLGEISDERKSEIVRSLRETDGKFKGITEVAQ